MGTHFQVGVSLLLDALLGKGNEWQKLVLITEAPGHLPLPAGKRLQGRQAEGLGLGGTRPQSRC